MAISLADKVLKKDKLAVAKLITLIEDESSEANKALSILHEHTGKAHIIGITGPPGCGKSTIVDKLIRSYRERDESVGVIAVDPTSPLSGGAILGDRIRMSKHSTDKSVFIRSMGSRGRLGGLAKATNDAIKVLDAFGMSIILVETVGVGQAEVEISEIAHTTVVIEMPGLGDEIQAIKAGILEIGDIFVVNKADKEGADKTTTELQMILELDTDRDGWKIPIIKTVATENKGIDELISAIEKHMNYLKKTKKFDKFMKEKTEKEFSEILKDNLMRYIIDRAIDKGEFDNLVRKIILRQIDPYSAADELLKPIGKLVGRKNVKRT